MKSILATITLLVATLVPLQDTFASDLMNEYLMKEGDYWINGVPNDHQRYSALCGVFRQDAERRQIAVVYVDKWDVNKNEVTGEPVGNRTVVNINTDDMDYVYGALAISGLCGKIPQILVDATANALQQPDQDFPNALLRNLTEDPGPDSDKLIIEE